MELLGATWELLGATWNLLGATLELLAASWGQLGASRVFFELNLEPWGVVFGFNLKLPEMFSGLNLAT